jgi:hypothetical protein
MSPIGSLAATLILSGFKYAKYGSEELKEALGQDSRSGICLVNTYAPHCGKMPGQEIILINHRLELLQVRPLLGGVNWEKSKDQGALTPQYTSFGVLPYQDRRLIRLLQIMVLDQEQASVIGRPLFMKDRLR